MTASVKVKDKHGSEKYSVVGPLDEHEFVVEISGDVEVERTDD